jgi:transmembrane sensor
LWKLVEVLNEAYDANIVIANDELKDLRLNVPFINESLDQVLNVVSLTLRIKVTRDGDQIILQ